MRLGIKVKFAGILVLATVLPLVVAILALNVLGFRAYRDTQANRFQDRAVQMADFLALRIDGSITNLHDSLVLGDFHGRLEAASAAMPAPGEEGFDAQILDLERRWPGLSEDSPELRVLLGNDLADDLRRFQGLNPQFSEIFVTDRHGRLVASTNKTTDYWQANEKWWQEGRLVPFGSAHIEGINFDESTGVYSFDLAIPIRDPSDPSADPAGVAKGVLRASPIFFAMTERVAMDGVQWECVLHDGTVLFAEDRYDFRRRVEPEFLAKMKAEKKGWMLSPLLGERRVLAGFSRLPWRSVTLTEEPHPPTPEELGGQLRAFADSSLEDEVRAIADAPLFVVVHAPAGEVFAPVYTQLRNVTVAGVILLFLSTASGFLVARNEIIGPIRLLQNAARHVSTSARLEEVEQRATAVPFRPATRRVLEQLARNTSQDELGELTHDIEAMARRVLRYHEHLKEDLAAKTEEIQRDLELAREYQEALMPRSYPCVPVPGRATEFHLRFHHAYVPTNTVGGDFFNVIRISDDRAGVFIGDVMGHGAGSALVTAIVGTLLYDLAHEVQDPAALLSHMNRHFHQIMRQCSQFVFVSAFYMIIDLENSTATSASGGHPSPLHARRQSGGIAPLLTPEETGPALGLVGEGDYRNSRVSLSADSLFFLFTDGILEARNAEGEEFGRERLEYFLRETLARPITGITQALLDELVRFAGTSSFVDDICFLAVEVGENQAREAAAAGPGRRSLQPRPVIDLRKE